MIISPKRVRRAPVGTLLALLFVLLPMQQASAAPILNFQDPYITHSVMGTDKFYTKRERMGFGLQISPYYTHTATSSKPGGGKTSLGNINGPWDMAALFYNAPRALPANLAAAQRQILTLAGSTGTYAKNYTLEAQHNPTTAPDNALTFKDVLAKTEKKGVRGQLSFDFAFGLGITVKGGIADMKTEPKGFVPQDQLLADSTGQTINGVAPGTTNPAVDKPNATAIYNALLSPNALRLIGSDIGLDFNDFSKTDVEDAHADVHWSIPIKVMEKGELAYTIVPLLSVGAWVPLAQERNQDKAFALSAGNDGYLGLTADGALSFDFPGMMQLSFGGGASIFNSRDLTNYRVPTSEYQTGIYPWKTSISRQPGPLWYLNVSMKAENFVSKKDTPNFSCFIDYLYVEHLQDTITLKSPNAGFQAKKDKLQRESAWKSQHLFGGITLGLSQHVFFGISAQSTIASSRTYRPTTFMASLLMLF